MENKVSGVQEEHRGKYEVLLIKKISWEYCLAREELLTRAEFKGSWGGTEKGKMTAGTPTGESPCGHEGRESTPQVTIRPSLSHNLNVPIGPCGTRVVSYK